MSEIAAPLPGPRNEFNLNAKIPPHFANQSLRTLITEDYYMAMTERGKITRITLWNESHYTREDYQYVNSQPGIDKIQSNGGFYLYFIDSRENTSRAATL
jgi:hypothetical protein